MLVVRITSGLGNQMYQYNFYRFLKERYPDTKVVCDLNWFKVNDDHHGFELEKLFKHDGSDFELEKATVSEIRKASGQFPPLLGGKPGKLVWFFEGPVNRILRERLSSLEGVNHINQLDGDISNKDITDEAGNISNPLFECVNNLDTNKDYYFTGFWIEERYVKNRLSRLQKEFVFPKIEDNGNLQLLDEIVNCNSVSIHVRRGDYLSSIYSGMFKCLGRDYYEEAIKIIKNRFDNPRFFLFSDDPEYMKGAFEWLDNKYIVDINHGDDSYKDMVLMSNCKANIIANSTFSQWGALLNDNRDALAIYPKDYLMGEDSEIKTYTNWIRI